ncbi:MAG: helix-turn-helix domain-containing protein [Longimicrobiales bacterium]
MNLHDRLRALVEVLPEGATVNLSRADLLALLDGDGEAQGVAAPADYTVEDIAARFDRSPNTVREWIRRGELEAYPFGREYRITPAALEQFVQAKRESGQQRASRPPSTRSSSVADLGSWRDELRSTG